MPQYVLKTSSFQSGQVGGLYHIGLSDGTNSFGYVFQNWSGSDQRSAFNESSNVTDKGALTQYSSQALIDRDLAYYPRVSQGDFSGGLLQEVFIDNTREFDSDLEIRTPGYLMLRPAWQRKQLTTGVGGAVPQSVNWKSDVYTTFGGANCFNSAGTSFAFGITAKFIATDGFNLVASDGVNNVVLTADNSTYTTVSTNTGTVQQIWIVEQGTNGRFVYLNKINVQAGGQTVNNLFRIDLNGSFPQTPTQISTGNNSVQIVDIAPYQNGIAVLANDPSGSGFEVWYHDGVNMTGIVRVNEYNATGIALCLGDLYVTAQSVGQFEAPVLIKISAGSFAVVVRTSSPIANFTSATIGNPQSSGQYVAFSLVNPQINNVITTAYVGVYDVISGAYSHLGSLDTLDAPQAAQPR